MRPRATSRTLPGPRFQPPTSTFLTPQALALRCKPPPTMQAAPTAGPHSFSKIPKLLGAAKPTHPLPPLSDCVNPGGSWDCPTVPVTSDSPPPLPPVTYQTGPSSSCKQEQRQPSDGGSEPSFTSSRWRRRPACRSPKLPGRSVTYKNVKSHFETFSPPLFTIKRYAGGFYMSR